MKNLSSLLTHPLIRLFRVILGVTVIMLAVIYTDGLVALILILVALVPLSAGIFNLCYINPLIGKPVSLNKTSQSKETESK
jgi:hypothetical protein